MDSSKLFAITYLLFRLFVHLQLPVSGSKDFVIFISVVVPPILNSLTYSSGFSLRIDCLVL